MIKVEIFNWMDTSHKTKSHVKAKHSTIDFQYELWQINYH
jgi:hypothetical protein